MTTTTTTTTTTVVGTTERDGRDRLKYTERVLRGETEADRIAEAVDYVREATAIGAAEGLKEATTETEHRIRREADNITDHADSLARDAVLQALRLADVDELQLEAILTDVVVDTSALAEMVRDGAEYCAQVYRDELTEAARAEAVAVKVYSY